jgi:hypothetical protein
MKRQSIEGGPIKMMEVSVRVCRLEIMSEKDICVCTRMYASESTIEGPQLAMIDTLKEI